MCRRITWRDYSRALSHCIPVTQLFAQPFLPNVTAINAHGLVHLYLAVCTLEVKRVRGHCAFARGAWCNALFTPSLAAQRHHERSGYAPCASKPCRRHAVCECAGSTSVRGYVLVCSSLALDTQTIKTPITPHRVPTGRRCAPPVSALNPP